LKAEEELRSEQKLVEVLRFIEVEYISSQREILSKIENEVCVLTLFSIPSS